MIALPDLPRWVEANAIAANPTSWHRELGAIAIHEDTFAGFSVGQSLAEGSVGDTGFAVGNDRAKLIVVAGTIDAAAFRALGEEYPEHTILVGNPRFGGERAIIHTLDEPDAVPDLEGAVVLAPDAPLDHLPDEIRDELRATTETIWSVWLDERPAAFAYAPWKSRRWFDVSVDVLPSARQLGLGQIVSSALIRDERAKGREPVWGADEANHASLALARRLGFVPVDELYVLTPTARARSQR